jgi:Polyphosphate kinase 2 (PPK2)/Transmembrane secretion effector
MGVSRTTQDTLRHERNSMPSAFLNSVFLRIWLASLISGTAVAAHETAATWTMNLMSRSGFFISLMASLASLPFFLFSLPAGAFADAFNEGRILRLVNLFFLHVSADEQKKRFLERLDNSAKNWKVSATDSRERGFWKEYMEVYEDMICNTATDYAPWYVVPADNKWFTRVVVAAVVIDTLASLNLQYPEVTAEQRKQLAAVKETLIADEKR